MAPPLPPNAKQPTRAGRVQRAITQAFFKGLIAILPIAATIYVLIWLANMLDAPGRNALNGLQVALGFKTPYDIRGTGLLASVLLIFIVGILINAWLVQQVLAASESLLQRLPLAKTVFSSVRDLMGFFTKSGNQAAGQVVIVELGGGVRMMGFVTRNDMTDLPIGPDADQIVAVYVPFSYAVGGFTLLAPRASLRVVDISAEEAMRFALTAGMKKSESSADQPHPVTPSPL